MSIPVDMAARILFLSDRTCCVCHENGKAVQVHHIDGNNSNHDFQNLSVLCLDCHTETQIQGGFHRKLDAEQVRLYRDDWLNKVARERAVELASQSGEKVNSGFGDDVEVITSVAETLRESEQYELLAIYYSVWSNSELRDKYIEKALSEKGQISADTEIFLRSLQGKIDLIDPARIQQEIEERRALNDLSQLARLYTKLGRASDAVKAYCQSIVRDLEEGRIFPAAFYLKELAGEELQELGWDTELKDLLISKKTEIEKSENPLLMIELYRVLGDKAKYIEARKKLVRGMRTGRRVKEKPLANSPEVKRDT